MNGSESEDRQRHGNRLKYGQPQVAKAADSLDIPEVAVAQKDARHCASPNGSEFSDPLGTPLDIGQVAALIGCSIWTVRQKLIPLGLPHFRIGSQGRIMFYRSQVIRWLLEKQRNTNTERR